MAGSNSSSVHQRTRVPGLHLRVRHWWELQDHQWRKDRVLGVHLHAQHWRELQDLQRRYEQESHRVLQHDSVHENNQRKYNQCQMWQTKSSNNIGDSWKKDIDTTRHDVPREPRKGVKWQENNRRKQHWSRNNDWNALEKNERDGEKRADGNIRDRTSRLREDAVTECFKMEELINATERSDEKMENFIKTKGRSSGNSFEQNGWKNGKFYACHHELSRLASTWNEFTQWTNERGGCCDRYEQLDERIANLEKIVHDWWDKWNQSWWVQQSSWRPESWKSRSNRISWWFIWTWSWTVAEGEDKRDWCRLKMPRSSVLPNLSLMFSSISTTIMRGTNTSDQRTRQGKSWEGGR